MSTIDRWESWLNPILIRSLRQSLRSRAFVGSYLLVLLIASAVATIAALSSGTGVRSDEHLGQGLFVTTVVVWTFAAWLVQGQLAFLSVTRERNENTWDLVELTGMRPWSVAWGLAATALVQATVIGSALAPFLVLSYLLRGVEIGTLLLALCFVPLGSALSAALGVFLGCLGNHKALRSTLGGLLGLGLTGICFSSIPFWSYEAAHVARALANDWDGWLVLGIVINGCLACVLFLLVLAAALLTHPAQDRSSRVRTACVLLWADALLCWLLLAAGAAWWHPSDVSNILGEGGVVLSIFGLVWATICGGFATTEPDGLTHRQRQGLSEGGPLRRLTLAFCGPGCRRGRRWTLVMFLVAAIPLAPTLTGLSTGHQDEGLSAAGAMACYALFYLGVLEPLLRRGLPRVLGTPALRRTALLAVVAVWMVLSTIAIGTISGWSFDNHGVFAACAPHLAIGHLAEHPAHWTSATGIVALLHGLVGLEGLVFGSLTISEAALSLNADRNQRSE